MTTTFVLLDHDNTYMTMCCDLVDYEDLDRSKVYEFNFGTGHQYELIDEMFTINGDHTYVMKKLASSKEVVRINLGVA